jgi:uncharacterized protein YvpB
MNRKTYNKTFHANPMKIDVPFFQQTTKINCGPTTLKMALAYLGKNLDVKVIEEKVGIKEGAGVSTLKLAISSRNLGYDVDFFSKHLGFDEKNQELDYYKKHNDVNVDESQKLVEDAIELGINVHEKTLSLENILSFITEKSLPIVLLDWNVVNGQEEKGYQGHFVPIIGHDEKNIYVHNPSFTTPQESQSMRREIFDKARKSQGTDEDVVVIYRKH